MTSSRMLSLHMALSQNPMVDQDFPHLFDVKMAMGCDGRKLLDILKPNSWMVALTKHGQIARRTGGSFPASH